MRRALLLICISILAGCSSEPFKPSTDQRNEAFEVFFSALIASNGSASMARKSAIVLRVDAAYFSSDSQVAVEGGYAEATLSFASYRLEMKKRQGKWVIEKRETFGVG